MRKDEFFFWKFRLVILFGKRKRDKQRVRDF